MQSDTSHASRIQRVTFRSDALEVGSCASEVIGADVAADRPENLVVELKRVAAHLHRAVNLVRVCD